ADLYTRLLALCNHAVVQVAQGQLRQAVAEFRQALALAAERGAGRMPTAGIIHLGLANVLYEWNDVATATFHLGEAIELGQRGENPRLLALSYTGMARVLLSQDDVASALTALQKAEQLAQTYELPPYCTVQIAACRARLSVLHGDRAASKGWVRARRLRNDDGLDFTHEIENLALARVLIAHDDVDEALRLLERLLLAAESAERWRSVIEILTLQATAFAALGAGDAALTMLNRALALAEPEGYIRTFVDTGAPMASLLKQLVRHGLPAATYASRLLAAFPEGL